MSNQDDTAIALDQIIPTERQGNGFPTPEEAAQYVDGSIEVQCQC